VRQRIFFKLLAAFALVIAAAAVALVFPSRSILLLLFAVAIALLIAGCVSVLTARRLRSIIHFADRVGNGDLEAQIAENSADEIGQIASSLDAAVRRLRSSFDELKSSKNQLETLLNSMEDAVIAVGPDDRVQWINESLDRLVPQRARLDSPLEETIRDPEFLQTVHSASKERKVSTSRASSILPGRTFDVTAAPLPGGGAVAVLRDLTETERMEKTRRDFIANVSHELRTPLTSIRGYTETLLDGGMDNGHTREFLDIIRKNASRMSRLTEDLLTLARVESGEHQFDIKPVPPAELLREACQHFRESARAQGIDLKVEDATSGFVAADREAIRQVFSNLVDNALKYGASGGKIVLGACAVGESVEFYVQDFGPGISSEHIPRLFERFYRVDKARSRESGGTGLGLAIAKHIMFAHNGSIRAESELNHGSKFIFTLPFVEEIPQ